MPQFHVTTTCFLSLCSFPSGRFMELESYNLWPLSLGFSLSAHVHGSSTQQHGYQGFIPLMPSGFPLCGQSPHSLSSLSNSGHLRCFHVVLCTSACRFFVWISVFISLFRSGILGPITVLFTSWSPPNLFTGPPALEEDFSLTSHHSSLSFIRTILRSGTWDLIVAQIHISLMVNDVEPLFMCILRNVYSNPMPF